MAMYCLASWKGALCIFMAGLNYGLLAECFSSTERITFYVGICIHHILEGTAVIYSELYLDRAQG